jgi:hypothetical protein
MSPEVCGDAAVNRVDELVNYFSPIFSLVAEHPELFSPFRAAMAGQRKKQTPKKLAAAEKLPLI